MVLGGRLPGRVGHCQEAFFIFLLNKFHKISVRTQHIVFFFRFGVLIEKRKQTIAFQRGQLLDPRREKGVHIQRLGIGRETNTVGNAVVHKPAAVA